MSEGSFFQNISSKSSFFIGVGSIIGLISFIGFIVLLSFAFGKDNKNTRIGASGSEVNNPVIAGAHAQNDGDSVNIRVAAINDEDHVLGNKNAKVSIIEFSDFECPFCKRLHPTLEQIVNEYDGDVKWVYRHFPLSTIHRNAKSAAEASECASAQGKFWEYASGLFDSQTTLGESTYLKIAEKENLDIAQFEACMDNGTYSDKVEDQLNQATAAGGRGTPYAVIVTENGDTIPVSGAVPYEQFQNIIQGLL